MQRIVSRYVEALSATRRHARGLRLLQIAIGTMLLYRVCTEGRFAAYLWGPHGLAGAGTGVLYGSQIARIVDWPFGTLGGTYFTVLLLGLAAAGLVLGIQTRLSAFTAITILW